MKKIKEKIIKIISKIKENKFILKVNKFLKIKFIFYIILLIYLIMIDLFNRYLVLRTFDISQYIKSTALIYNFFWISLLLVISYVLKGKLKRIYIAIICTIFFVFSIANYFIIAYFGNALSWKDLVLSGEGFSFISSIIKFINIKLILFTIVGIILIIALLYLSKYSSNYKIKSYKTTIFLIILVLLLFIYNFNSKKLSNVSDGWDASEVLNNNSNYYSNWINPNKLILIGGTYDYIFRDFYESFLKRESINKSYKKVEEYINNNDKKETDDKKYKGIFENKNLIFVMMESLDDWMISKEVTPTIWEMMQHGFNFTNHYSPVYVTGSTANTEFIANTGIYPNINKLSPNYAYQTNNYVYSLPNLFKNYNYTVNSFHRSNGTIYNREQMHISFGYEKYYNYSRMEIEEKFLDLDSYIAKKAYDKIVSSERFMSFIITYSPHTPYTYSKIECKENLKSIQKLKLNLNEEQICALSSARETDNMFKILIEKLEKDKLLEDTVIVAFTDHPNNVIIKEDESEKLNKTLFFIYNKEIGNNQIDTISSTIDILPTIKNLFNLDNNYIYPGNDLLNIDKNIVIFNDYTYFNGKEILSIEKEQLEMIEYSKNLLISDYYK